MVKKRNKRMPEKRNMTEDKKDDWRRKTTKLGRNFSPFIVF